MKKLLLGKVLAAFIILAVSAFFINLQGQVNITFVNDSADVGTTATGGIQPLTLLFKINSVGQISLDASTESDTASIIKVVDAWDSDSVGITDKESLFGKSFALRVTTNKRLQCGYSETGARGGLGVQGKNQRRVDDGGKEYIYFVLYGDAGVEFTSFAYSDVNNGASGKPNFRFMDYDSDETYFITKPGLTSDTVYSLPAGELAMMYPLDSLSLTTSDTITGADGNEGARLYGLQFNVVEPAAPKPLPAGQFALEFPNATGTDVGGTPTGGLEPLTLDFAIDAQGKISVDASTGNVNADVVAVVEAWDSDSLGLTDNASLFGKTFSLTATTNKRLQCAKIGGLGVQGRNQWRIDDGGTESIYFELEGDVGLEVIQFKFRDINEAGADLAHFRISDYNTDENYFVDIFGGDVGFYNVPDEELILRYRTDVLSVTTSDTIAGDAGGKFYGLVLNITEPVVKPPDVLSTAPVDGDTLVEITSDYVIRFDTPMEQAVTSAAVTITPAVANRVNSWNTAGDELTISFDDLQLHTAYTVTVGTGVKGTNGLNALAETIFTFQTLPDLPTVVHTYPVVLGKQVPLNTPLAVEFSTPMIPSSVEQAISFEPALAGLGFVWNEGNTMVYMISDEMVTTNYTVTISTAATDIYGQQMAEPFTFGFSTWPVSAEEMKASEMVLYPNPASDILQIRGMDVASVKIFSLTGQLMKEIHNSDVVNVSDIPQGSYLVTVTDRDDNRARKLIVID